MGKGARGMQLARSEEGGAKRRGRSKATSKGVGNEERRESDGKGGGGSVVVPQDSLLAAVSIAGV